MYEMEEERGEIGERVDQHQSLSETSAASGGVDVGADITLEPLLNREVVFRGIIGATKLLTRL